MLFVVMLKLCFHTKIKLILHALYLNIQHGFCVPIHDKKFLLFKKNVA
jgi:hypothetical protein